MIRIAGLALTGADVLFNLLEAGFDSPSCTIVLDDLFGSQIEISRKERNPLGFTKDPDIHILRKMENMMAIFKEREIADFAFSDEWLGNTMTQLLSFSLREWAGGINYMPFLL